MIGPILWLALQLGRGAAGPIDPAAVAEGRKLYNRDCTICHGLEGTVGDRAPALAGDRRFGPDLSNIGGERRPAALRDALTRSGRRLPRGYRPVKIRMRDGRAIEGLVKNEDSFSLQVLGARDLQLHLLDRSDAVEVIYSDRSLMPSDYAQRLTAAEIDDLLAFLARQVDGRPQP